jgi:phage terminase large subunit GpA-like protein
MIPFGRALVERNYKRVVQVAFGQGGKTETLLDVIGRQFDQSPVPVLYVGPNKQFLTEQFEPRLMALLDEAPKLRGKLQRGKRMTKTRKVIAGVPLRLAHAGSPTALKSDPAGLALTDEADDLMANVKGQGDPIALIDVRGDTHADFVHGIVSTPSEGPSEVERDEHSGLEFWKVQDAEDVGSKIWRLWQEGTRHHFTWPCPHCAEYFVLRFSLLKWPEDCSPVEARREAYVECPHCKGRIDESHKADLNERGQYVAPGQWFEGDEVKGDPPESSTLSLWCSGLASPFVTIGQRAESFLRAVRSGDQETVRAVINGGFAELYAPGGGDAPEWMEVQNLTAGYPEGSIPAGVVFLTAGVDVQKTRLIYVIRGWGLRQESWLIEHGTLWGETIHDKIWFELEEKLSAAFGNMHIRRAFIDSGFKPQKRDMGPEHKVYEFVRRNSRLCFATKGVGYHAQPLSTKRIEVTASGKASKYGVDLVRLNPDFFKSWVHQRIRWPKDQPGAWHLHASADEDYCRQITAEARMRKPSGHVQWIERSSENHFLDCEALAYAAAFMIGVQRMNEGSVEQMRGGPSTPPVAPAQPASRQGGGWLGNTSNWLG